MDLDQTQTIMDGRPGGIGTPRLRGVSDQIIAAAFASLPSDVRARRALPPLSEALGQIERQFSIARILRDEGRHQVRRYYRASEIGYRLVHSREGCMHLPLSRGEAPQPADYLAQARSIEQIIHRQGARRVLELGSGQGFNLGFLARRCPDIGFAGLDLMPRHVQRASRAARGQENLAFVTGSFEDPPEGLGTFDLVFAVEALCHARDLPGVARTVARLLAPGGIFVMFDAVRAAPLEGLSTDMATAVRLYETVTAVSQGFRLEGELDAAFRQAGLVAAHRRDLTAGVATGARRLYRLGQRYFDSPGYRLALRAFPVILRRNAAAAILGPYLVEGPAPGQTPPAELGLGYIALAYRRPHELDGQGSDG